MTAKYKVGDLLGTSVESLAGVPLRDRTIYEVVEVRTQLCPANIEQYSYILESHKPRGFSHSYDHTGGHLLNESMLVPFDMAALVVERAKRRGVLATVDDQLARYEAETGELVDGIEGQS